MSKDMRDAVDATGRKVKEFGQHDALERGYVSTLKCLRRRGRLSDERLLCAAAARIGDLEALKALRRAENFPWDEKTCTFAAKGGPRGAEVGARERLPVARADMLGRGAGPATSRCSKWARENGCPWDKWTCAWAAGKRPPRGAEVGARERLPVERGDVLGSGEGGHLEVLKWARENGCPWDEDTCARGS